MITAVTGVMLTPDEAEFVVGALDEFVRVLAERHSKPSSKLAHTLRQLRKASQKSAAASRNVTRSPADEADSPQSDGYATVTTAEAARILGVSTHAVRTMAQRNPRTLGSRREGSRWTHQLVRVEHRAARKRDR